MLGWNRSVFTYFGLSAQDVRLSYSYVVVVLELPIMNAFVSVTLGGGGNEL